MTTQYTLSRFEVSSNCRLADYEIKTIKARVNQHIETINEGLDEGYKFYDLFIQTYYYQVIGMSMILPAVGILFEIARLGEVKTDENIK
ncbi:hypothetical protein [Niallia sp. RD1]|uniref:hypothetical protein n=1 Tax=Niallia sp. RD1 TaxID=2962858 RepID=UPI0020C1969C|nr:hypothetical protein [Niallia sp. RD1]UTI42125.1 hypothetical protein NKG37_25490 [Niallia sp. RD1]